MDGRHFRNSLRRLRLFADEAPLTPEGVSKIVQPFIDEWRPVATPNRKDAKSPMENLPPEMTLSGPALVDLAARVRVIGMTLNKQGLKGVYYHNAFQRHLAGLAETFDCRGWMESQASFDDPEGEAEAVAPLRGRVDVIWARNRKPVAVFEIDSTVKARSFQKLKEAAAPHKFWIYFGKDVWGFKMFLQREDPGREVVPVIVPNTFVPSFADREGEGARGEGSPEPQGN
jgi:hypothetical protein